MQQQDLDNKLLKNLDIPGWNAMQQQAHQTIHKEKDVLLLAPTGSGKTLAFLKPVLQSLKENITEVQCLILVPSRELALQIEQVWKKMATGYKIGCFYGGHSMPSEIQSLTEPPAVLIGTPGRIADHLNRKTFITDFVTVLVLDEFDKSLALGFEEDMSSIISRLRKLKKRVLVSATTAVGIPDFTGVKQPEVLDFITNPVHTGDFSLKIVRSPEKDKINTLIQLLSFIGEESAIIFCNHRDATERTSELIREHGIENVCFHGGMEQLDREQSLIRFRNGTVYFLVATDLAARGLDIPEVKHIIHYHLPHTQEEFTHRNGRTARMHASGTAYMILHAEERVPSFVEEQPEELALPDKLKLPKPSEWTTVYISGGKKDKLNKIDIVGFFSKIGKLEKGELGMIEVKDFISFAAVKKNKVKDLLHKIKDEKMKGKKYKIAIAK